MHTLECAERPEDDQLQPASGLRKLAHGPLNMRQWSGPAPKGAAFVWRDGKNHNLLTKITHNKVQRMFGTTTAAKLIALTRQGENMLRRDRGSEYKHWLGVIAKEGRSLPDAPWWVRTPEMNMLAIVQYGWAMQWVPEHKRTAAMCLVAIKEDGAASLALVPAQHKRFIMAYFRLTENKDG